MREPACGAAAERQADLAAGDAVVACAAGAWLVVAAVGPRGCAAAGPASETRRPGRRGARASGCRIGEAGGVSWAAWQTSVCLDGEQPVRVTIAAIAPRQQAPFGPTGRGGSPGRACSLDTVAAPPGRRARLWHDLVPCRRVPQSQWILLVALTALALYLCWSILRPFLPVLLWAAVLVIVFHPAISMVETAPRERVARGADHHPPRHRDDHRAAGRGLVSGDRAIAGGRDAPPRTR